MKQQKIAFLIKSYDVVSQVVKMYLLHPMETGLRQEKSGAFIPANYISKLSISLDGERLIDYDLSKNVSKNPFFSFGLNQDVVSGQKIKLAWIDNHNVEKDMEIVAAFNDENVFLFRNYELKSQKRKPTPNKVPALIRRE